MAENEKPAIVVKGITKTFKIPFDKSRSVKSKLLGKSKGGYREFTPLNDVSFTVNKGDFFGIVGRNGSGKSTLLKTIAGIYNPTRGSVKVDGTLVPFIELGVGFNPQLSGKDNVYLNGALLGFSREEISEMYDDIVSFAELDDFMDERLQNYSSGMQVRLAFSISIRARGDILLLDEVLAVGDASFQQKCYNYFEELKQQKKTVILVTHNMANVDRFCNKGLLLEEGKIQHVGSSEEIAEMYRTLFYKGDVADIDLSSKSNDYVRIKKIEITQNDKPAPTIRAGSRFRVEVNLSAGKKSAANYNISLNINDRDNNTVLATNVHTLSGEFVGLTRERTTTVAFDIDNIFTNGHYDIGVSAMAEVESVRQRVFKEDALKEIAITGFKGNTKTMTHPHITLEVK